MPMMRFLFLVLFAFVAPSAHAQRTFATADVTINVDSDPAIGTDQPGCGIFPAAPCATPQYAADILYSDYDFRCRYKPTVQLSCAPSGQQKYYAGLNISGRLAGQCGSLKPLVTTATTPPFVIGKYIPFTLRGDPNNPLGCFINPGREGRPGGACISLDGAALKVEGVACDTALAAQDGFDVYNGSHMDMSHVWFGNAGYPGTTYSNHVSCAFASVLTITGDYGFSGSGWFHINNGPGCTVDYENNGDPGVPITVTILNNPSFSGGIFLIDNTTTYAAGVVWNGTAQGTKAVILRNGVLWTNTGGASTAANSCNQTYLPGTLPVRLEDNSVCR